MAGCDAAATARSPPACLDVVEDPLLVAPLFVEVVQDRLLQPGVPRRNARTHRHQQRHRVAHVVIGLGQEFDVQLARDLAREGSLDRRRGKQVFALGDGVALQLLVEVHRFFRGNQEARSAR